MNTMTTPMSTMNKPASTPTPKSRADTPAPDPVPTARTVPDRIRGRAFEIYQTRHRNGTFGDTISDWLQAEREINGSAAAADGTAAHIAELKQAARGERLLTNGK